MPGEDHDADEAKAGNDEHDDFGPDEFDEESGGHDAAGDGGDAVGQQARAKPGTEAGASDASDAAADGGEASEADADEEHAGLGLVIIDGDASHAASLHDALKPASGGRVDVLAVETSEEAGLHAVDEHRPQVVVLGLNLPGGSLGLLEKLLGKEEGARIVAVAGDDATEAAEAAAIGAHAVVTRTTTPEHLLAPILGVVQGWRVLADPVVAELVAGARRPGAELLADFDDEEVQLWMLVAEGLDLGTIANRLEQDETTTKQKVADLRTRVGATNRTQLAALAGRAGLVDDGWLDGSVPGA